MKRFGALSLLSLVILDELASSTLGKSPQPSEPKNHSAHSVFTTTVDWYKPIPRRFGLERGISLPSKLFNAVPIALREEATLLLGTTDIIPLTGEQAARFSSKTDPDSVLCTQIEKAQEKLKFFQEIGPVDPELVKRYGKHEVDEWKKREQSIMEDLKREIKQLGQLEHRLKPYLIKGVALEAGGNFSGMQISENIVVRFDAMGSHAVPMARCPVVAFLPQRPHKVYTTVGMMQ
jgi:hypothetical protein